MIVHLVLCLLLISFAPRFYSGWITKNDDNAKNISNISVLSKLFEREPRENTAVSERTTVNHSVFGFGLSFRSGGGLVRLISY